MNLTYETLWNVDWDRKWLVSFNAGKILFFSFDRSNNTGATDMRMDVCVLESWSDDVMFKLSRDFDSPCPC